jgi:hypothetical protein
MKIEIPSDIVRSINVDSCSGYTLIELDTDVFSEVGNKEEQNKTVRPKIYVDSPIELSTNQLVSILWLIAYS